MSSKIPARKKRHRRSMMAILVLDNLPKSLSRKIQVNCYSQELTLAFVADEAAS